MVSVFGLPARAPWQQYRLQPAGNRATPMLTPLAIKSYEQLLYIPRACYGSWRTPCQLVDVSLRNKIKKYADGFRERTCQFNFKGRLA